MAHSLYFYNGVVTARVSDLKELYKLTYQKVGKQETLSSVTCCLQ